MIMICVVNVIVKRFWEGLGNEFGVRVGVEFRQRVWDLVAGACLAPLARVFCTSKRLLKVRRFSSNLGL